MKRRRMLRHLRFRGCIGPALAGGRRGGGAGLGASRVQFSPFANEASLFLGGLGLRFDRGGRNRGVVDSRGHRPRVMQGAVDTSSAWRRGAAPRGGVLFGWDLRLLVADWRREIDLKIGLEDTDGFFVVVGFRFQNGHLVYVVVVAEGEDVAGGETGEVAEALFQDGFWIGDLEEICRLRLKLDKLARRKIRRFHL